MVALVRSSRTSTVLQSSQWREFANYFSSNVHHLVLNEGVRVVASDWGLATSSGRLPEGLVSSAGVLRRLRDECNGACTLDITADQINMWTALVASGPGWVPEDRASAVATWQVRLGQTSADVQTPFYFCLSCAYRVLRAWPLFTELCT
jgi:hypothetical protein